jgi:hypothetical protein
MMLLKYRLHSGTWLLIHELNSASQQQIRQDCRQMASSENGQV